MKWFLRLPIWSALLAALWFYGPAAALLACIAAFFAMWAATYDCEVER